MLTITYSFNIQTTPRSEKLFESLSETVNASIGLPSKSVSLEPAKTSIGHSQQEPAAVLTQTILDIVRYFLLNLVFSPLFEHWL